MPKRCLGDYISSLEDSSEVSEMKTQEKTQKLKEKTQNSRKKLNFSAYSYVGHEENVANLQACYNVSFLRK